MALRLYKISNKKVKIVNPRKWQIIVRPDTKEILEVPYKPFIPIRQLENNEDYLIEMAKDFLQK